MPDPQDSFVPDSFTPDEDSFVADSFVPDEASNNEFVTVQNKSGGLTSVRKGETLEAADRRHDMRPDSSIYSGQESIFDWITQTLGNQIATNEYLPEAIKPALAGSASLAFELPRFIADALSQPDAVAAGLAGMGRGSVKPTVKIPEVLPPEKPIIRGLLPEKNPEEFIVGAEGRTLPRSLAESPQEQARLSGYDIDAEGNPVGHPSQPIGTAVDFGELRESERLRNLNYTDFEHQGGVPLILPDRPRMNPPAYVGDTSLGFSETVPRSGELEYPLNVVPQAVQPRRSQTVMQSIVPDRFANELPAELPPTEFVSGQAPKVLPEKATRNLLGGTAALSPDEPILPSAVRQSRRKVRENTGLETGNLPKTVNDAIETHFGRMSSSISSIVNDIKKDIKSGTLPNSILNDKEAFVAEVKKRQQSIPPPISKAVADKAKDGIKAGVVNFVKESEKPSEALKTIYTQLSELGAAGKQLVQKFQRAAQNTAEYDAVWTEPLFPAGHKLSKFEKENFGAYVEQRLPIPNARVQRAVDQWNVAQNQMGDMAVAKGLHLKRGDEVIPFEKVGQNYWPRIPTEGLDKKTIVDKLMANGMTRHEAAIVAKRYEATGEIFLGAQRSRLRETFPYRDDYDVAIHHARSMSKRIANHENLGPKDIAGKGNEGIANLIEDSNDPTLAVALAKRLAGRESRPSAKLVSGLNQTRKWMSLTSLPNFSLPNIIQGNAMNAHMAIMSRHPLEAVKEITKLFRSSYRDQIRASGVFNTFNRTLLEELQGIDPFQIGAGEKINRGIAAAIGRSSVRTAFEDYKAGVNVPSSRYFIETLLARDPDSITAITPELERFAAGRMAEITQGLNNPGNLPYGWSNPINSYGEVTKQLFLIFKKIGFQNTKTIKDTIMMNPTVAIPSWLALGQIAGELTGDVKSALTGRERPDDWMRIVDNWGNAYMLGLPWDIVTSAQYGPAGFIKGVAGPAFSKGSELMYDTIQTGKNLYEEKEDPFGPLRNFGLKNLPIPARERIRDYVEED